MRARPRRAGVGLCGALTIVFLTAAAVEARAQPAGDQAEQQPDLTSLPIEQLMNIEVTSVAKKPQRLATAAAAVFVITQEDIRRSGMTSIPELLRMVPGLDVAQIDSRHWAISSRGFNDIYSSKLLVLVDGRSVYSPSFAGVFWDTQDTPLEDIERIEVIRGPGGTIWGANAVNGVINIITKSAQDTQGLLASAGGGTEGDGLGTIRYGGKFANDAYFRVYAKGFQRGATVTDSGADAGDSWNQWRAGFRVDWNLSGSDTLSAQGAYYGQSTEALFSSIPSLTTPPMATKVAEHDSGGDAMVSWSHRFSPSSDFSLQAYFDRAAVQEFTAKLSYDTYDIEFRDHLKLGDRHDIVWGGGYRRVVYDAAGAGILSIHPPQATLQTFNVFGQDEIALGRTLHLIAGVKLEHDTYTGLETEPSLRLTWTPAVGHTLWAAVSRAIRVPSFGEVGIRFNATAIPGPPPTLVSIFGNPGQLSEREVSWELGYRAELTPRLSVDAAAFYSRYSRVASVAYGTPFLEFDPQPAHVVIPIRYGNLLSGKTYGAELSVNWQPTRRWRLSGSYTALVAPQLQPDLSPALQLNSGGSAPRNQFQLHSMLDLPGRTEFDVALYRVGAVKDGDVPAYTRMDVRLGWRATDHLELSLAGQNLLQDRHMEFSAARLTFRAQSEVPRAVFVKATIGY